MMATVNDLNPAERAEYNRRIAEVQAGYDRQLAGLKAEHDQAQTRVHELLIGDAVRVAAMTAGIQPGAVDDVVRRGATTFRVVDGVAVPFVDDAPALDASGNALGAVEWVSALADTAPHLFHQQALYARSLAAQQDQKRYFLDNLKGIASGKVKPVPEPKS